MKEKEIARSHPTKADFEHDQTGPNMEPPRQEQKRDIQKQLWRDLHPDIGQTTTGTTGKNWRQRSLEEYR